METHAPVTQWRIGVDQVAFAFSMPATTLYEKLDWRAREYTARLRYWLARKGLLASSKDYHPFIILCGIRTGSTMLTSFLKSHSNILMFFELFHVDRTSVPFGTDGFRGRAHDEEVVELRNTDPAQFLEQEVFRAHPAHTEAVGFKLLYTQARSREMWWDEPKYSDWWEDMDDSRLAWRDADSDLWAYLRSRTDVKVLHLVRENLLRQKVSAELATTTGRWGKEATGGVAPSKKGKPQVALDPEVCKRDFAAVERKRRDAEQDFDGHDLLCLSYEQILDAPNATLERIQRFLDLDIESLQTRTEKQEKRALDEVIANYSELQSALSDTPWIRFFDE